MADDLARLGIIIDAKDATAATAALGKLEAAGANVQRRFDGLKGLLATIGLGLTAKGFLDAGREAENLTRRIDSLSRTADEARETLSAIDALELRWKFDDSDIKQSSLAIKAIAADTAEFNQIMQIVADTAEVTGSSMAGMSDQIVRAMTAGADTIRDKGLKALLGFQEGVQVSGQRTKERLMALWNDTSFAIAGAADRAAKGWDGAVRAMSETWEDFQKAVMLDGGVLKFMTDSVRALIGVFGENEDAIKNFGESFGKALIQTFQGTAVALAKVFDLLRPLGQTILAVAGKLIDNFNKLPAPLQQVGIIGALFGGLQLRAVILGVTFLWDKLVAVGNWLGEKMPILQDLAESAGNLLAEWGMKAGEAAETTIEWALGIDDLDLSFGNASSSLQKFFDDWNKANENAKGPDEIVIRGIRRINEVMPELQAAADGWKKIWENVASGIQSAFVSMFEGVFTKGSDILASLAATARRIFAEFATQAVFGRLLNQIAILGDPVAQANLAARSGGGAGGGGAGSALGGLGGLLGGGSLTMGSVGLSNFTYTSLAGMGASHATSAAFANAMNRLTSPVGLLGGLAGGLGARALFGGGTGTTIGSTLGGIAGSFIPIPGVGTAIGSFLGGAVGSLFNKRPSDRMESSVLNMLTGQVTQSDLGPGKDSPENRAITDAIIDAAMNLRGRVSGLGGRINVPSLNVDTGTRSGIGISLGGVAAGEFQDASAAVTWAIKEMAANIEGLSPIMLKAFQTIDLVNDDRAGALIQFASDYEKFLSESTAPKLTEIERQFKALDEQLVLFRENLSAIGQSAEDAVPVVAKLKKEIVDGFVKDLDRQINELSGHGYINAFLDLTEAMKSLFAEAAAAGIEPGRVGTLYGLSAQRLIEDTIGGAGSMDEARTALTDIVDTFKAFPEIVKAANDALLILPEYFKENQAVIRQAAGDMTRVFDAQLRTIESQVDGIRSINAELSARVGRFGGIAKSTGAALTQLAIGDEYGLSPETRLGNVRRLFGQTLARSNAGDLDASEQLADLGLELVKISGEFYGITNEFFADRDMVEGALTNLKSVAEREITIATRNMIANEATLALLQEQAGVVRANAGGQTTGFSGADATAITNAYTAARNASGMSDADWAGSAAFRAWEGTRDTLIGGLTDVDRLVESFHAAQQQATDPIYGPAGSRYLSAVLNRANQLGVQLPGRATGGAAGMAFRAHPNEVVFLGNRAQVLSSSQARASLQGAAMDTERIERAVVTSAERQVGASENVGDAIRELRAGQDRLTRAIERLVERV